MDEASEPIAPPPPAVPTQLIVFADDWGRHPSSSQHLVRELLPQYPTLWVNTVGTRRPGMNRADLRRALGVVSSWLSPTRGSESTALPAGLQVVAPKMYPGYRKPWQRRFNAGQVAKSVIESLLPGHRHAVVTTLPTTADLVGKLEVDRWVYYCVDDYSQWPGTDHAVMDAMERELVAKVEAVVCVSETLRGRVASIGRDDSTLLTHGVDLAMWRRPKVESRISPRWPERDMPVALFWGLADARLDGAWCIKLSKDASLHLVFAGPVTTDKGLVSTVDTVFLGPLSHSDLPAHAAAASVLVMPYIDAPVTRAMQPLKLLEYLATMKPVVVRDLPSTRQWADCCDLASDAQTFAQLVVERAKTGTPAEQLAARQRRLPGESWSAKAAQLAAVING